MIGTRWNSYWAEKSTPQYARDDAQHYREYAAELRLLFEDPTGFDVYEIGCGNGSLHEYLGFTASQRMPVAYVSMIPMAALLPEFIVSGQATTASDLGPRASLAWR
jgi:hypothetical protein